MLLCACPLCSHLRGPYNAPFQTIAEFFQPHSWQRPMFSFSYVHSFFAYITIPHYLPLKLFLSHRKNKNSYPSLNFATSFFIPPSKNELFPPQTLQLQGLPLFCTIHLSINLHSLLSSCFHYQSPSHWVQHADIMMSHGFMYRCEWKIKVQSIPSRTPNLSGICLFNTWQSYVRNLLGIYRLTSVFPL
jgi:hypothetical protein